MIIKNWQKIDLSSKISFIKGKAPRNLYNDNDQGTLPYLTPDFLRGNAPVTTFCPEAGNIKVKNGDLVLLWDGSNAGEVFRAKNGALASTMSQIIFDSKSIFPVYLYYYLKCNELQIKNQVNGSGIPHVDKYIFGHLPNEFPIDINEQCKIAEILTIMDDAIEQTEAVIQKLRRIKQGLVQDLLTRGVDENGSLRPLRELSPNLYFKTAKGWLPKGWDVKTIKDISAYVGSGITPTGGSEVYSTEGILFIRSQNVTFEGLLLNDVAFISEKINKSMKRSEIFPNDVLLNITGASIGRCCVFPAGLGKANVNQHVCAIRLIKPTGYDADFLSLVLSSWIGQIQIDKLNAGGNRQGLNYEQLRSFQIPWPGEDERRRISEINQKNAGLIFAESNNLKKLCLIKKGLMQDLLTGKVRVNYE